ncbi:MAG: amidohydrolase family protein [Rhodospirillales bacterium]|nr:amidohydrolase family protein [Rhodospirillales bacterium]
MSSPSNADWLTLTTEETLEPDLPICDPHHHLWEFRYERSANRYLLNDILEDINVGHNIVSTVFMECGAMWKADGPPPMRVIGETEFVNGIAAMSASGMYGPCKVAAGIICTADLTLGAPVGAVLDAQLAAGGGRVRGIRYGLPWDASDVVPKARTLPPQHLMRDETFRQGFAELAKRNMSFEIWCYHHQLPDAIDLARAFPDTTIILDHFGGPLGVGPYAGKADEVYATWCQDITELAKCQNVNAKLGGINMIENGFGWHEKPKPPSSQELMEATRRYYEFTIAQFGVDRCMFESNFPVDQVSCSYNVLWNSFKRLTAGYSAEEKAKLYHDTATRVYRL